MNVRRPLPALVVLRLALEVPRGLPPRAHAAKVREVTRAALAEAARAGPLGAGGCFFEVYDDGVAALLDEAAAAN